MRFENLSHALFGSSELKREFAGRRDNKTMTNAAVLEAAFAAFEAEFQRNG